MSLLDHTPATTAAEAERVAREVYGVAATASPLPSERDRVFLLTEPSGDRCASAEEIRGLLRQSDRHSRRDGSVGRLQLLHGGPMPLGPSQRHASTLARVQGVPASGIRGLTQPTGRRAWQPDGRLLRLHR